MRLVRIGCAVWDVLAIVDDLGRSVLDDLHADQSDRGAGQRMLVLLETHVPLNGPPRMNKTKCRDLGEGIYEFKEPGLRVLWFYDDGRRIVCTHSSPKVSTKEFQPEIKRARRLHDEYIVAKTSKRLNEPKKPEECR